MLAVVDTSALYAAADADDDDHARCVEVLNRPDHRLVIPALVITLDRRDFGTVRPRHRRALRLLP